MKEKSGKLFSVVLALVMVFSLLPMSSFAVYAEEAPKYTPLTFTAEEAGSVIWLNWKSGTEVQYSIDGSSWSEYVYNADIKLNNVGDKVSFKGSNVEQARFGMKGKIAASGDVTSLTNRVGGPADLTESCYSDMFSGCESLTSAPKLPATTLSENCYSRMFWGCTSLTSAPELPATALSERCYDGMFGMCTGLTSAPELPATTLADECYVYMFSGCESLTSAPELPATDLAPACYESMFLVCTSLTSAPELPAETLKAHCYASMFWGCTSLSSAPELPAIKLAPGCYASMFRECANLTNAPVLPATTLDDNCYPYMFKDCVSLNSVPVLSASSLNNHCYTGMFSGCTNLKVVETTKESEATWKFPQTGAEGWNDEMIEGLTAPGTLTEVEADKMYKVSHVKHPFTYSASGSTLTVACIDGCELKDNRVDLILIAEDVNYSGSEPNIKIEGKAAWEAVGLTVPTEIIYEKADGTALDAAPTEVGSYVAKVSPVGVAATAENTAKVSFTIEQAHEADTSKYVNDETNHWNPCMRADCAEHKYSSAAHSYDAATHKCVCGELDPAYHQHELGIKHESVSGNCVENGTIEYYDCAGTHGGKCGKYLDAEGHELASIVGTINPENHKGTAGWIKSETTHKEIYACCNAVKTAEAEHIYAAEGAARYTCTVCAYEDAAKKAEAEKADKEQADKEQTDKEAAAKAKELADAKEAAKKAIDEAAGTNITEAVKKAIDDAKKAIDAAATVDEVAAAKNAGVTAIKAAKAADEGSGNPEGNNQSGNLAGVEMATAYDTILIKEYPIGKGNKKGITIGNIGQGNASPLNGVVTVNANIKVTMPDAEWIPAGYVLSRVTPENLASAQWISIENDKKALKEFKKLAAVKFNKKQNQTLISTKQNKKVPGGVYAIRLLDGNGNIVCMNIECIELNKNIKKSPLTTTTLDGVPSVDTMLQAADSSMAKTVGFTLTGSEAKSAMNANAVVWTAGSGKSAITLKKGEVSSCKDKKGNAIAYLTVADDGSVKVLSGTVKGSVTFTAQVNGKKYKTAIKVKTVK